MVYFIRQVGTSSVKIGYSADIETFKRRIATLQTANIERLEVIALIDGDETVEDFYHRKFKAFHKRGEWFDLPADTLDEMEKLHGQQNYLGAVGGASAFDVRQVRGRQQYQTPDSRKAVPDGGCAVGVARHQPIFLAVRGEHEICLPSILWEARKNYRPGNR